MPTSPISQEVEMADEPTGTGNEQDLSKNNVESTNSHVVAANVHIEKTNQDVPDTRDPLDVKVVSNRPSLNNSSTEIPSSNLSQRIPLTVSEQIRLVKDKARLKEVVQSVSAQAAQQVLRENWRFFLFDGFSDAHVCFILRAGLKNASSAVLSRVFKDEDIFNEPLRHAAAQKPLFVSRVLEKVSERATLSNLLDYIPEKVVEWIVAEKIKEAPARDLINWLASGDRLGFRKDDYLDESDESVVPNIPVQRVVYDAMNSEPSVIQAHPELYANPPVRAPPALGRDPLLLEQEINKAALDAVKAQHASLPRSSNIPADLTCKLCKKQLPTENGYLYHTAREVCTNQKETDGRWRCDNCLSTFIGKQGIVYHDNRNVCKKFPEGTSTMPSIQNGQIPRQQPTVILPPQPVVSHVATPKPKPGEVGYMQSPSDVAPEILAAMNKEIDEEEAKYQKKIAELPTDISESERQERITAMKNGSTTRKSVIRKKYGVSLRLREKDKRAKQEAQGATPPARSFEQYRPMPTSSSAAYPRPILPPKYGNGPAGANAKSFSSSHPQSYIHTGSQPLPSPLPGNSTSNATYNPRLYQPIKGVPNVASAVAPYVPFGVLKGNPPHTYKVATPTSYQQGLQNNKRRRTSEGTSSPGTGYNSPQFPTTTQGQQQDTSGMVMMHSEDAGSKYAKNLSGSQQAQNSTPSTKMAVVLPSVTGSGTKDSAYTIISSSEDEGPSGAAASASAKQQTAAKDDDEDDGDDDDDDDDEDIMNTPVQSVEQTIKPPGARREGFMAKRGGKH